MFFIVFQIARISKMVHSIEYGKEIVNVYYYHTAKYYCKNFQWKSFRTTNESSIHDACHWKDWINRFRSKQETWTYTSYSEWMLRSWMKDFRTMNRSTRMISKIVRFNTTGRLLMGPFEIKNFRYTVTIYSRALL